MSKGMPSQVKDKNVKTKVFDWHVPVKVGNTAGAINGTLFWQPRDNSGVPGWAVALLAVLVLGGAFFAVRVRQRRDAESEEEAW
jgi:hypothetical protein